LKARSHRLSASFDTMLRDQEIFRTANAEGVGQDVICEEQRNIDVWYCRFYFSE
jgi:hypothetical protein